MQPSHRCASSDFCDELADVSETSFFRTYQGNPESRLLGQTANLAVLADLSPLTLGHILVLSKFHYLNFAQVARLYLAELEHILNLLLPQYNETFGKVAILEHGSAENMANGACITHAHLHLLPISRHAVEQKMEDDGLRYYNLLSWQELGKSPWISSSYYLSGEGLSLRLFEPMRKLPQQYLRSVAGGILGIPDPQWDWAVVIRKNLLRETMTQTSGWTLPLND